MFTPKATLVILPIETTRPPSRRRGTLLTLTRRFLRAREYKSHVVFTRHANEEVDEWKRDSTFFF